MSFFSTCTASLRRSTAVTLVLAFTTGCGSSGEDYGPDETAPEEPEPIPNTAPVQVPTALTCPTGSTLTYENFGASFMNKYCTSCHSQHLPEGSRGDAPLTANFDTAEDVAVWRAAILAKTGTTALPPQADGTESPEPPSTMPPGGGVLPSDRASLAEWLRCGAPRGRQRP